MESQIVVAEKDFEQSIYSTKNWEQSVDIVKWEHDYENKRYVINYRDKSQNNH